MKLENILALTFAALIGGAVGAGLTAFQLTSSTPCEEKLSACTFQKASTINLLNGCRARLELHQKEVEIHTTDPSGETGITSWIIPTRFLNAYFEIDPTLEEVCFNRREWYSGEEEKKLD